MNKRNQKFGYLRVVVVAAAAEAAIIDPITSISVFNQENRDFSQVSPKCS